MPSQDPKQSQAGSTRHPLDRYTVLPQQNSGSEQQQSPYYKSQAPSISLPKGGGALKGIDEKFNVNAVNGTAGLEIPFPLSPGRGGFTPALSLSYNSGSGNSEFGMGWGMSLPSIQRRTDKRLPRYDDEAHSDIFLLAGAEDLVPSLDEAGEPIDYIDGDYRIRAYRPRIEGLFARIELISAETGGACWWRVATKDNILTYYGLSASARIADPEAPGRVFRWLPELVVDHKGNAQRYYYAAEDKINIIKAAHEANRAEGSFANTYLKSVGYCNLQPFFIAGDVYAPAFPAADWLMEAVLDYGDHDAEAPAYEPSQDWQGRSDAFSDFHAGFEIRTYRRCRRVLQFHRFRELNGDSSLTPVLVRSLDMAYYQDQEPNDPALPNDHAGIDYIVSITQTGYYIDGSSNLIKKSLPPVSLSYQPIVWDHTIHSVSREDAANAPQGLSGNYQWTDFFGEGLPGILSEQGNAWWYKRNLGDGHFNSALNIAAKPSLSGLGNNLQWQDLDADGRRQVVTYDSSLPGYFEAALPAADDVDGLQEWEAFRTFRENINIDWNSPFNKMLDLDGDGRPDLLLCEDRVFTWYRNKGKDGFGLGGYSSVMHDEDQGPRLLLNDQVQSVFLADLNGDGLTDLVRIRNGEVCYWPNKGFGRFGTKVTMSNAPVFDHPDNFNPQYIYISDISGTGAADILYLAQGKCTAYINRSGNSFSEGVDIASLPGIDPYSKVAVIDFLGNGTGCIVWSSPLPQYADAPLRYIDLMGGKKPHLMQTYSNGLGKQVSLTYKSSTQYYLADRRAGTPWATKLPFPVHCIEEILSSDLVSETSYRQHYSYHHGYYDHAEREFRGFGRVDTIDTDTAEIDPLNINHLSLDQDPVLTKSWYHTGAWMAYELLTDAYDKEYFKAEDGKELPFTISVPSGLSAREQREAYRALKGSPLRQEVYALDGSVKENIPYTISSFAYCVQLLQPAISGVGAAYPDDSDTISYGVFFNYQEQKLVQNCERYTEDPRVAHEISLQIDTYGNVLQAAQIVYGRVDPPGFLPSEVVAAQQKMQLTYSRNTYTNDSINNNLQYRLRLPAESISCEVYAPSYTGGLWTRDELFNLADGRSISPYSTPMSGGSSILRQLSHSKNLYRENDALSPLPLGELESLAIPHEQYTLAFSDDIIASPITGGQLAEGAYTDLDADGNYWVPSGQAVYGSVPEDDFYSVHAYTDPWGNAVSVTYWDDNAEQYWLLPRSVSDALGNISTVNSYNWHSLQATRITDPNGNVSDMAYDALGMPLAMALKGKVTPAEGDNLSGLDIEDDAVQHDFWDDPGTYAAALLGNATMRCVYRFPALSGGSEAMAVAMIGREMHYEPLHAASALLIRITYTDGFGRVAMHKVQTTDAPLSGTSRWIGSGKTVYNNKGKTVLQYEPYFSDTHTFDTTEQAANLGGSPRLHYDPLGRVRRTDMPDGSYSYTIWDGWMQVLYDANDACLDSDWYNTWSSGSPEQQDAAAKAAAHAGTPTITLLDSLARPFYTIQLLEPMTIVVSSTGLSYDLTGIGHINSFEALDVQGNRLALTDGRGNQALRYTYNLLKVPMRQISIDSGTQYMLADAGGQPLYAWDADNRAFRFGYDALRRAVLKEVTQSSVTRVLERMQYGESLPDPEAGNLRGQLYRHWDGAGTIQVSAYDFKGNPLGSKRIFTADAGTHPDWTTPGSVTMELAEYDSATLYDALNRPTQNSTPEGGKTLYTYDKGGMLYSLEVADVHSLDAGVVNSIEYDAKGQRQKIQHANGSTTSYAYDPDSFRVIRIRTTRSSDNKDLQDLRYWYDAVGNITLQKDDALQTVFYANTVAEPTNDYTYDALYRLVQAKGRELAGNNGAVSNNDAARSGNSSIPYPNNTTIPLSNAAALRRYIQYYTYDEVGNMTKMQHTNSSGSGNWTRNFTIDSGSNRLAGSSIGSNGSSTDTYAYDNRGNMSGGMNHLNAGGTSMTYNAENRLESVLIATGITAYYQYDGSGQRVRKTIVNTTATQTEQRLYVGEWELYTKFVSSSLTIKRESRHVSDDTGRILLIDSPLSPTTGESQLMRYTYSNHLGSATLELDDSAAVISYEEYYPYGSTSFQSGRSATEVSLKRYRYTGKERDEETGLYYHGARYYIPWLARWSASDPMENKYAGMSPYNYSMNNPVMMNDLNGANPTGVNDEGGINGVGTKSNPIELEGIAIGSKGLPIEKPTPELIQIPQGGNVSVVDNASDVRGQDLGKKIETAQAVAKQEAQAKFDQFLANARLDQPIWGADKSGHFYSTSIRGMQEAEHQENEQYGEIVRSGGLGVGIGYLFGGKEGAKKGYVFDGVAMSFSNVGTPFGKVETSQQTAREYIPNTELSVAGPRTLPNEVASTFMGGNYTSRYLEQDAFIYRSGDAEIPFGRFFSPTRPQGILQERIDKAILPIWPNGSQSQINTGFLFRVPAGVTLYEGLVAPQGGVFLGGTQQIFINNPWNRLGIVPIATFPLH